MTDDAMACPECHQPMYRQDAYVLGIRRFQHFMCDNIRCPVSSIRVEWRTM